MRYWNAWGCENSPYEVELDQGTLGFLQLFLGEATALGGKTLEQVAATVPPSRLPDHPLLNTDSRERVRHALGQSFPDSLAWVTGDIGVFPDAVAFPQNSEQVREILDLANRQGFTVIPYGGGTSVAGHINPLADDNPVLTLDMGQMNSLIALDRDSQIATIGAGANGPQVEALLNKEGYTLGHFPQSWELSTLGGWVATRSSGQQSLRYGRIEQLFAGGRIETLAGRLDIPTIPASSAGPDVREMILGSEGRMGVITEVCVRVTPLADNEQFQVVYFPSWEQGMKTCQALIQNKIQLSMLRLSNTLETLVHLFAGNGETAYADIDTALKAQGIGDSKVMMTFGVTGLDEQCKSAHALALQYCEDQGGVLDRFGFGEKWRHGRFSSPYLRTPFLQQGYAIDTMETALDWSRVPDAVERIEAAITQALAEEGEKVIAYTHLSHVYAQGSSVYTTYAFRCGDSNAETMARWHKVKSAGAQAIVDCGGTISHQHGVGFDHKNYLSAEKGELGIQAIQSLCDLFDRNGQMNPHKLLP